MTPPDSISNLPDNSSELDWLAFQYVAGELSAAQTVEFELRLADELPVCEALARAVQVWEVVRASLNQQQAAPIVRAVPVKAVRPMARAAAACLVAGLAATGLWYSAPADTTAPGRLTPGEVVALWSKAGVRDGQVAEQVAAVDSSDDELEVPGWMLSVVSHESASRDLDDLDANLPRQPQEEEN